MVTLDWCIVRWRSDQRLRFLVAGGWNTLFGYLTYLALYLLLRDSVNYLLLGVMAHAIAVVQAFIVHRAMVFSSTRSWPAEFIRFNIAQTFVLACGLVALWFLVSAGDIAPLTAQAIVTVASILVSYVAHRSFTFATR